MSSNNLSKRRELLDHLLTHERVGLLGKETILRRNSEEPAPLSFSQQRLWFLHQLDPQSSAYNLSMAVRFKDALNLAALEQSIGEIVRRHEILRTCFASFKGQPAQVVAATKPSTLLLQDFSGLSLATRQRHVQRTIRDAAQAPFDLEHGPLLRTRLLRVDENDHILLVCMHHTIGDGWSTGLLTRELMELYQALSSGLPSHLTELPIQYADFAQWQRDRMQGDFLQAELAYWKSRLEGRPASQELGTDHPRPSIQNYNGATRSLMLPTDLTSALRELCRRQDVTLFMAFLAALSVLLYRYTGQDDVIVGTPIANRNRREIEGLVGFFVNTLVLRSDLSGNPTFLELLGRVRVEALGAYEHQDLPFEQLVEALQTERDLARTPLFQVCLIVQDASLEPEEAMLPGPKLLSVETDAPAAKFDLTLIVQGKGDGLSCALEYNTDLFDAGTIERKLGHLQRLLQGLISNPSQRISDLPILTEGEERVLKQWNNTDQKYLQPETVDRLFEAQVAQTPEAIAVISESGQLSYAELNRRANQVAHYLQRLGAGPEVLVGISLERSIEMVIGLLGILKAGSAFMPLDPDYPQQRLTFMLNDAQASLLLTHKQLLGGLPDYYGRLVCLAADEESIAAESTTSPVTSLTADNLAYVIYTSGSTGKPKGALNTHRGICNRLLWMQAQYQLDSSDRVMQKTPISFDVSLWEFFWPLLNGAGLFMARPGGQQDNAYLVRTIIEQEITTVHFVPTMLQMFLQEPDLQDCTSLQRIICSGEALSVEMEQQCLTRLGCELHNLYGPTEAAVDVTFWRCSSAGRLRTVPIGRPIANTQIFLLDDERHLLPVGIGGELYIGGIQLSRGYLNRPELTAEKFVPNPHARMPGQRLYQSGDLARYLSDGSIDFLGRLDHQVKVRGFRIEPEEIESALAAHPAVAHSVVMARDSAAGKQLVAYVVTETTANLTVDELRRHLQQSLPGFMVPSAFVFLQSLPMLPNGKLDRQALPVPGPDRPHLEGTYVAPSGDTQEILAAIWASVLKIDQVGIHDTFFAVGGDSILSIQVLALARERGLNISLQQLFQYPTISELAIQLAVNEDYSHDAGRSLPFSLVSETDLLKLPPGLDDAYPLTRLQDGMLFHMELQPDIAAYHNINCLYLQGRFDLDVFREVVQHVVNRHPNLRTSFDLASYSEPLQLVHKDAFLPIAVDDIRHLSAADQREFVDSFVQMEVKQPFDRARAPQMRFQFHLTGETAFYFTVTESHAIDDGWSLNAMLTEIFNLYFKVLEHGTLPEPAPLSTSFRDFVQLERAALQSEECRRFWEEKLQDYLPLELPAFASANGKEEGRRIRMLNVQLPQEVSDGLKRVATLAAVPLKSVLLAVHVKVMSTISGQTDVITGLTSHGRPEYADGEQVLGLFLNTLPFRLKLPDGTWLDLVRAAFNAERELLPYRRYPLSQMQAERRGRALFDTNFNFVHFHIVAKLLESDKLQTVEFQKIEETNFKLVAGFGQDVLTSAIGLELDYDSEVLGEEQIDAIAAYYLATMSSMAQAPLSMHQYQCLLAPEELDRFRKWNDTLTESGGASVSQLFEKQVERSPDAIAVVHQESHLSYRELNLQANLLAQHLRSLGVGPEVRVGIQLERSIPMVIALLGILKAGGVYVPLDPTYPLERVMFMIDDADVDLLITEPRLTARLPEVKPSILFLDKYRATAERDGTNPANSVGPDNLAYVIYTSGSTGQPKGVMINHRGLSNYLLWATRAYEGSTGGGAPVHSALSFDLTITALFTPLITGQAVVLLAEEPGLEALTKAVKEGDHFNLIKLTPSHLKILEETVSPDAVRGCSSALVIGGEALTPAHLRFWQVNGPQTRLINEYGPTETVVGCCTYEVQAGTALGKSVPIGRPIANVTVHVLDRQMKPVPVGVAGELYVGGMGVARGYGKQPAMTADMFLPDPFSSQCGQRLYRTHDIARYLPDGNLEFMGRNDEQVKVRGYRIEPGEIQGVLLQHEDVTEAVVVAREAVTGETVLVAYVVARDGALLNVNELRALARAKLPDQMVPAHFVMLEALPLTTNGKLNRSALPVPAGLLENIVCEYVAPRNEVEEMLVAEWTKLFKIEGIGIHHNFFELGGYSLTAARLVYLLNQALSIQLPLRAIFDEPTVAGQASLIQELLLADLERLSEDQAVSLSQTGDGDAW